jgi:hypothetical protein
MWRIVITHADDFYPHIAFFDVQFIVCMARMVQSVSIPMPSQANVMELFPVVLDMALCTAYWIENVLAGRPLLRHGGAVGQKRPLSAVSGDAREEEHCEPPGRKHAGSGPKDVPEHTKQAGACAIVVVLETRAEIVAFSATRISKKLPGHKSFLIQARPQVLLNPGQATSLS